MRFVALPVPRTPPSQASEWRRCDNGFRELDEFVDQHKRHDAANRASAEENGDEGGTEAEKKQKMANQRHAKYRANRKAQKL